MLIINVFYIHLLDIPSNEERKRAAYREKITECIDRAEKLKELIEQQKGIFDSIPLSYLRKQNEKDISLNFFFYVISFFVLT
jgi:hypothetical protein